MYHKRLYRPHNISKVYYLAFEGKRTEQRYFSSLEQSRIFSRSVCTVRLHRGLTEESMSNPKSITKLVLDFRTLQKEGIYSTDLFICHVLDYLDETYPGQIQTDLIRQYAKELKNTLMSQKAANDKQIIDQIEAEEIARFYFQTVLNREIILDLSKFKRPFNDDSIEDEYCIIVDRDEKSFTELQVNDVKNTCNDQGLRLIITNPCFELWLLLHFDVSKERITECIRNNSLKKEVSQYSGIYEGLVSELEYAPVIGVARSKLEQYAQDLDTVSKPTSSGMDCVGSNIGFLMDDLTDGRYP